MAEKRIIDLAEATEFSNGDYLVVDSAANGTRKIRESRITDAIGAPLVATTVAGMTDIHRVYVYVGSETGYVNGNWYYYNGSSWVSGGIYNSAAVVTDTTLSISGKAADAKAAGDAISNLANGVVASSEQLISKKHTTDKTPYIFRTTGGSVDVGDREYVNAIVGGTVAWNQLLENGNFASASGWGADHATTSFADNTLTMSPSVADRANFGVRGMNLLGTGQAVGHKYLVAVDVKVSVACEIQTLVYNRGTYTTIPANTWTKKVDILNLTSTTTNYTSRLNAYKADKFSTSDVVQAKNYQVFDLTQMFGSTIADYIYSLETATAGAGVAYFKSLGFNKPYYEYNEGELMSVSGLQSHDMTGFNAWDEVWERGAYDADDGSPYDANQIRSKNYIHVLPDTNYYIKSSPYVWMMFFDENKNILTADLPNTGASAGNARGVGDATFKTPKGCAYIRFYCQVAYGTTYNHDICINLAWDNSRNGEYEPYIKHSYPLDNSVILRGMFKLDANNNLYADGDIYPPSGEVTRKYGVRAYQSGDESLEDAITDGTNTVYKLTTPTTETADPYTTPQICDDFGTEEYTFSDSVFAVPVGSDTDYPENLRKKIEGLPWDFSTLIAPTEVGYKATRNYTTGSLLIVNNILYKVTANIANGGTITPNTNVTATTLSEVISAL